MKKGIGTIAAILLLLPAMGRAQTGRIIFTETMKMQPPQVEGIDSAMLAAFPTEHTMKKELLFDDKASLYRKVSEAATENELMEEPNGIVIRMNEPDDKVYTDFAQKKIVEQRDFMSRMFLIEQPLEAPKWKLTGMQKTILGYVCQEALIDDSLGTMKVWFTPQIAVQGGPGVFSGFPGMVLGVEMNDGDLILVATQIDLSPVPAGEIARPTEGKKVSEEKFRAMVDEKTREMQEQYGGDGHTVIRVIRED
jgi:GLPGLI family protein